MNQVGIASFDPIPEFLVVGADVRLCPVQDLGPHAKIPRLLTGQHAANVEPLVILLDVHLQVRTPQRLDPRSVIVLNANQLRGRGELFGREARVILRVPE